MTSYLLGIDAGTSFVKSVIFDDRGHEIAVARRATPVVSRFSGGSEIDMTSAWLLTAETIREVLAALGGETVAAVGLSGTACGFWGINAEGQPLRDAILWNDGRAASIVSGWQADGFFDRIFAVSGNAPFPGYPMPLLCWLHEHEPAVLEQTRWLLFHKDWLRYQLTGAVATEISDIGYFPGDIAARGYSPELLREAGLSMMIDKLPPLLEPEAIAGTVTEPAGALTGLRPGTPVVAGAVDVVASLVGGGAVRAGQACSILGTSLLNTLVSDVPSFEPAGTGAQASIPGGLWARSFINTAGTMCIDWMVEQLAEPERRSAAQAGGSVYEPIEALVQGSPPGAKGLIFLPYLNTAGIVSPFPDAEARGMFFGLSVDHTRADLLRAVYEGVALAMRDGFVVSDRPVDEVLLVGGGARSAFWAQLFADVTGCRIVIPDGTEFGARGAALLAGAGAGMYRSVSEAVEACVRPARVYDPHPERTRIYDLIYPLYRQLSRAAPESWHLRASIMRQIEGW
jgi:sugar (pentulose or hexulose) kinase